MSRAGKPKFNLLDRLTIDPMKIPRPERSGYLAVLFVYVAMYVYGEALMLHDYSDNLKDLSITCWLAPWMCPKAETEPKDAIEKKFHVITLYPGKGKKEICSCHYDMRMLLTRREGPPFERIEHQTNFITTCDGDDPIPRTWTTWTTYSGEGQTFSEDFKWHCE